jgi:NAD+ synthase (glutamine-hydrolysing)
MKLLKVAAGAVNQTPLDWQKNKENILAVIEAARNENVSMLCLPELCISGYGCEDAFYAPDTVRQSYEILFEIVEETANMVVCVGLPLQFRNNLYNVACVISDKKILGFVCKQHLPNYGLFYEDRWFQRWRSGVKDQIELREINYPIGDLFFEIDDVRIGLEICEDAWVANRPGRLHFDRGVDIILNPSASPFAFHKFETRERLVIDASRTYACSYIYTNLLGNESGRLIFDGDAMIASNGSLLESSPRFSYADFTLTTATIDIEAARISHSQIKTVAWQGNDKITSHLKFPENIPPQFHKATLEAFERGGSLKEEEFARAVCLALFDYLRKSRSQGFTISLSGGADSCACTALAALMIRLADESIGLEKMKAKLSHIKKIQEATSPEAIAHEMIHTVYQGTENSSTATLDSARSLAESVGARFHVISINGLVETYTKLIEEQLGRELTWQTNDLALQNIQARVRAPGVWLMTNLSGHLLLATSNRSEVAVGYCTMDGDTAGSISPIAGIDKHWLRHWLRWLETTGCEVKGKQIKIEGLKKVNALSPTAELRPSDKKQTDEADLMPYEVLDFIEKLAIRDKKCPVECLKFLEVKYNECFTKEELYLWTTRFFRLWARNQWKRERYAPSFHLDDLNLDPRSWCRFPILSGGFEKELQELTAYYEGKETPKRRKIGF